MRVGTQNPQHSRAHMATDTLSFEHITHHSHLGLAAQPEALLATIHGCKEHARTPLDLVAVVDRSGSMSGAKLELVKQGLRELVSQLSEMDTFGLVCFDDTVTRHFSNLRMDHKGKHEAWAKCNGIRTGGSTNLSGGVIQGLQDLPQKSPGETRSASVMVFTDGHANQGITEVSGLLRCMQGAAEHLTRAYSIYCFGFGQDHCAETLRSISDSGDGLYYFLDSLESIKSSFGDCLGGLLSVVAQNVFLTCLPIEGKIQQPRDSGYAVEMVDGSCKVSIGDVNSEERKDLIFWVDAPEADKDLSTTVLCKLELEFFDVQGTCQQRVSHTVEIPRAIDQASRITNDSVEEHLLRVQATQAIDDADKLATSGDMLRAATVLSEMYDTITHSPMQTTQLDCLQRELSTLKDGFTSQDVYTRIGNKRSRETSMAWKKQKSATNSALCYSTPSKKAYRDSFLGK